MSAKARRGLVALTVAILAVIVGVLVFNAVRENQLQDKIAQAKAAGFPFTGDDLVPPGAESISVNAADVYSRLKSIEKSIAYTDKTKAEQSMAFIASKQPSGSDWRLVRRYIAESEPLIEAFVAATRIDDCYFAKDWHEGAAVLLPEYAYMKTGARLTGMRALFQAVDGKEEFLEGIAAIHGSARHAEAQPPLIALLVAVELDGVALESSERLLPAVADDRDSLLKLRDLIAQIPESWDMTRQLESEANFAWWCAANVERMYEAFSPGLGEESETHLFRTASRNGSLQWRMKMDALNVFVPALREYKPMSDESRVLDDLQARFAATNPGFLEKFFFDKFFDRYEGIQSRFNLGRADKRALLAMIDVLLFRLEKGRLPSTLAETGFAETDPFSGKPFGYRTDEYGFRVWSVGRDKVDNGGVTVFESRRSEEHDDVHAFPARASEKDYVPRLLPAASGK